MAGKLYVDEIKDTATTGSPSFPNKLDITELVDPVGEEGEVLTVQADGSIAAAAAGGGWPMPVAVADVEDADVIGAAIIAALEVVGSTAGDQATVLTATILSPTRNDQAKVQGQYDGADWSCNFSEAWERAQSGAGTILVHAIAMSTTYIGGGP